MIVDTEVIRAESHAEIGALLQSQASVIIDRWCRKAPQEMEAAARVHHEALRDDLPAFLVAMGEALAGTAAEPGKASCVSATEHGQQRWENGWSVTDLVRDYQLIRLVVLEYLEENLGRSLRYREVMAVGVFLDDSVAASVQRYVAHRDEEGQRVEREKIAVLEDVARRKDEFLAVLGHELRNPLAPIRTSVQVMRMLVGPAPTPFLKPLDVLDRQTGQLVRLADDLLDLSRIGRGELELRKTTVDLRTILDAALQMSSALVLERDHHVEFVMAETPIEMVADPERMVQIVGNLLNNAARYTEPGGRIRMSATVEDDSVCIRVSDTGIGIAPGMLLQVFEIFEQVDSTGRGRDGLGVGLALVKRLVGQHGGTVTAHSAGLGCGTEFVVLLPAPPVPPID